MLQEIDALLTLTQRLVATSQVVLRNDCQLDACFVPSCGEVGWFLARYGAGTLGRVYARVVGDAHARLFEHLVYF